MGRDLITGIVLDETALEWTTLRRSTGRQGSAVEVAGSGRINLERVAAAPAPETGGQGKAGAASAPEQAQPFTGATLAECGHLRGRKAIGIASKDLMVRVMRFPKCEEAEFAGMVSLQVDKVAPFPVEMMVVGHEVLEAGEETNLTVVCAAKEDVVTGAGARCAELGFRPKRVDARILGWWRLLKDAGEVAAKGRQIIVLHAGPVPELIITQDGQPLVFRTLDDISDLPAHEFAGEMVHQIGYTLMSVEMEHGEAPLAGVSVWSRDPEPAHLAEQLKANHSCEVKLARLESLPPLSEGLARRALDGAGINLIPAMWRAEGATQLFKKQVLMAAAAVFGGWLLLTGGFLGVLGFQKWRLASLQRERDAWQAPAMQVRNMRGYVATIKRYTDTSRSVLECLREISTVQPQGVELTSFSYRKGEGVKISGDAGDVSYVYDFKTQLDQSGSRLFTNSVLNGPHWDDRKKKQVFDMDLKMPGGDQ